MGGNVESIRLEDSELVSVVVNLPSGKKSIGTYLIGIVAEDITETVKVGSKIMTPELEWHSETVFITGEVGIYETSSAPTTTDITCTEFLLMRLNSLGLEAILMLRSCSNKKMLVSAAYD